MRRDRISQAVIEHLEQVQWIAAQQRAAREAGNHEYIKLYNSIPKRDLSFGRLRCTIPHDEFRALAERNPDLIARDKDTQKRAWDKLEQLGILKHYRYRG